jgi:hypothetical protein
MNLTFAFSDILETVKPYTEQDKSITMHHPIFNAIYSGVIAMP